MRTSRVLLPFLLGGALALSGCASSVAATTPAPAATTPPHSLFEYSTINALVVGLYDGGMTIGQLKRYGDFGIGTINGLNGEVVEMDDQFYQIADSGKVNLLPDSTKTPWMIVTHFAPQQTVIANNIPSYSALGDFLAKYRPNDNVFYAMEIQGTFSAIKARSVPLQHKPFPPLTVATAHQAIFHFKNVKGTVFGFWTPSYLAGINVPGYHLHFLTEDRKAGGHVLELAIAHATVRIEQIDHFQVDLPNNPGFSTANLATQTQAIQQAETDHPS